MPRDETLQLERFVDALGFEARRRRTPGLLHCSTSNWTNDICAADQRRTEAQENPGASDRRHPGLGEGPACDPCRRDLHWPIPRRSSCWVCSWTQVPTHPILVVMTARPEFQPPWRHQDPSHGVCRCAR